MKIDVFNHIITPRYKAARLNIAPAQLRVQDQERIMPALFDLDARFRAMDSAGEGYVQITNIANPPVEHFSSPREALELSRIANDELAELVTRFPDRFAGAAACVPLNDVDAAVEELHRAINENGLRAAQIYTDVGGRPLDDPRFVPFFDAVAALDVPILLHPVRAADRPDYPTEDVSRFDSWRIIGWLYDTVSAMARMTFSGLFDRHPHIKIVTHHLGGFVPYASERLREGYDKLLKAARAKNEPVQLKKHPYDYFHDFYADTITIGSVPALRCGVEFFGIDRVMFATDMPFDTQGGLKYIEVALRAMEQIDLSSEQKSQIYEQTARRVFRV